MEHKWYTIRQYESLTRRSRSTLYRWIDAGKLDVKREGNRVYVRSHDGTIDIPHEAVEDGTGGQVGQLVSRMEQNALQLSEFMQISMSRLGELERENGELNTLLDLQRDRIEELEGVIQRVSKGLTEGEKLRLLTGGQ